MLSILSLAGRLPTRPTKSPRWRFTPFALLTIVTIAAAAAICHITYEENRPADYSVKASFFLFFICCG